MDDSTLVTVKRSESGYIVRVQGKGTRHESPSVRDFVCGAIEDGASVVLDLAGCEYLDSTFLGCLVILHKRGCENDGRFRVCADESAINKLLHPTRLDQVLSFCPALPESRGNPVALKPVELERLEFGQHLLATHDELAQIGGPHSTAFELVADQLRRELSEQES